MKIACPKCKQLFDSSMRICPKCGAVFTDKQIKFRALCTKAAYSSVALLVLLVLIIVFSPGAEEPEKTAPKPTAVSTTKEAAPPAEKPSVSTAQQKNTITKDVKNLGYTPTTFVNSFNNAGKRTKSDLNAAAPTLKEGEVYSTFFSTITRNLAITGAVDKKTKKVISITMIGTGDGTLKSGTDIFVAIIQLIATVSPQLTLDQRGKLLTDIGLLQEGGAEDGQEGAYILGDLRYFYIASDTVGLWFGVELKTNDK